MNALETHLFGGALFSAGRGGSDEHQPRGKTARTLAAALVATGTLVFVSPAQADTLQVPRDFATIQAAIDAAVDFDHIIVAPGEYVETIDFSGKTITVRGSGGPDVTTIDGNDAGTVVTCANGEGPGTVLHGFTITNGDAEEGGGMRNINSSPTVVNCMFIDNFAAAGDKGRGGAMFNQGSDVTIIDCVFDDNWAEYGGGCYSDFSDLVIIDTVFLDNYGLFGAFGGMFFDGGSLVMDRCEFRSNDAGYQTGALYLGAASTSIVTNCLFVDNHAHEKYFSAFGALLARGEATIANCTFSGNIAFDCPEMSISANTHVTNCIIDSTDSDAICGDGTVTDSLVNNGFEGEGNIESDPMFVDPDNGNFRLAAGSPAIDAGNNNAVPRGVKFDLDGNPRIQGCGIDMGAYESPFQGVDCNDNGISDGCDIADGTSSDCNDNGVPDECDSDCNDNGIPDECDIADGASEDCNTNGIPDECEADSDCNDNGIPDECDLADGTSEDCNNNGVPDECDLPDCNGNGIPDSCDIIDGTSEDCNTNAIPDECEVGNGDIDGDGDVDGIDLLLLLAKWGPCEDCAFCPWDLDVDGIVGTLDLMILLGNWD